MSTVGAYWGQLGSAQVAALPPLPLMQGWWAWGWGLVLAALLVALWARMGRPQALKGHLWGMRLSALAVVLWCLLPGEGSPAYWLGLAFQAPSLSAGALALLVLLRAGLAGRGPVPWASEALQQAQPWALAAVLLGWVLLLDTFAFWPLALYPWGFGVSVWVALLAAAWGPWAWWGGTLRRHAAGLLWTVVLGVFVVARLPSGNVWDAVLDPWLWVLAHAVLLKKLRNRYKK